MDIKWGLQDPPMPRYLYLGETIVDNKVSYWYEFNHDSQEKVPVFKRALIGKLSNLILHVKEFKGKKNIKLDIFFQTPEEEYVVRSGIETTFLRTFLLAINEVKDFDQPLTLVLHPGSDGKVFFAAVHYTYTNLRIKYDWDENIKLGPIINQVQHLLGVPVTTINKNYEVVEIDNSNVDESIPEDINETDDF